MWPLRMGQAPYLPAYRAEPLGALPIIDARIHRNSIDIALPCPLNVHAADWDALLDGLCTNLTLDIWCDAVTCGFSKTSMGKATSWLWHDTLMDKYAMTDLPNADYRLLHNMLEHLWSEDAELFWDIEDDNAPFDFLIIEDNLRLLNSMSANNVLGAFLIERRNFADGEIWSSSQRITKLSKRLEQDLLLTHERYHLWGKMDYFLMRLDQSEFQKATRITEPVYQQIRDHLWQHMKVIQREQPDYTTKDILKTWDEEAAAASIRSDPLHVDFLTRFCQFAEVADYG